MNKEVAGPNLVDSWERPAPIRRIGGLTAHRNRSTTLDSVLLGNKEAYEYASNLNFAANLKGKLLLIHGTSDACAPFSNTMKIVDALIRAGKQFDLLVMPGQGHDIMRRLGRRELYWREAIRRYFQEHLNP